MLYVVVPHTQKEKVSNLTVGDKPYDPPLSPKGHADAAALTELIFQCMGCPPRAIYRSDKRRCRDTAEPAVNRWGLLHKGGVPVIEISLLAQPESGDDLGIFAPVEGYKSNAFHWRDWALRSKLMMVAIMNCPGFCTGDPRDWTLVTTHRPLAAAFLYLARTPDRPIETAEDINALDSTLLPVRVYDDLSGTGWKDKTDAYRLDQ